MARMAKRRKRLHSVVAGKRSKHGCISVLCCELCENAWVIYGDMQCDADAIMLCGEVSPDDVVTLKQSENFSLPPALASGA